MNLRQDQHDRFVLIKRPDITVVWGYAPTTFIYHATVDTLRSCCRSNILLDDADAPLCFDRSDDIMTCGRCIGLVRRIIADPIEARKIAVGLAAKRARWTSLPRVEPRCSSGKVYRT